MRLNEVLGKEGRLYLKGFEKLSVGATVISDILELRDFHVYRIENGFDWTVATKVGLDLIMSAVGFVGPIGLAISGAYFVLDIATDSFGGYGRMY